MKETLTVCNLADHNTKVQLMRIAIETLSKNPDMGIVVALLITTFIDSLAESSKLFFYEYLESHFPELDKEFGFMMVHRNLRNKAVHEFAVKPPLALAHRHHFTDGNTYKEIKKIGDQEWTFLNVDRLTEEFLRHLDKIKIK
jgi:hypothetical protein